MRQAATPRPSIFDALSEKYETQDHDAGRPTRRRPPAPTGRVVHGAASRRGGWSSLLVLALAGSAVAGLFWIMTRAEPAPASLRASRTAAPAPPAAENPRPAAPEPAEPAALPAIVSEEAATARVADEETATEQAGAEEALLDEPFDEPLGESFDESLFEELEADEAFVVAELEAPSNLDAPEPPERPAPMPAAPMPAAPMPAAPMPAAVETAVAEPRDRVEDSEPEVQVAAPESERPETAPNARRTVDVPASPAEPGTANAVHPDGDFEPPVKLYGPPPRYPQADWVAAIEGDVVLRAAIDAEGLVTGVDVLRSLSRGLDEAATRALEQWRFRPARRGGEPVASHHVLTFRFAR